MKVWIVHYWHRHGDDFWPEFTEPTESSVIAGLDDWEGPGSEANREDEGIEIRGPWEVPTKAD